MTDAHCSHRTSFHASDLFLLLGASAGIGLAVAEELARNGASLILCARSPERLRTAVSSCQTAAQNIDQTFQSYCLDLVDPDSPRKLSQMLSREKVSHKRESANDVISLHSARTLSKNGSAAADQNEPIRLRGVLLNGGGPHGGSVVNLDLASLEEAHALLFKGPAMHLQAALPHIQRGGSVVAITSTTVKEPHPALTLSGCYRSALTSYLKSLSLACGPEQIRVNTLAPGFVNTEQLGELLSYEALRLKIPETQVRSQWAERAALGRIATPHEIAKVVQFLFSAESSFITGQTLIADGGQVRAAW